MLPLEKRYAGGNPAGFHVKVFDQTFFKKFVGVGEAHGFLPKGKDYEKFYKKAYI